MYFLYMETTMHIKEQIIFVSLDNTTATQKKLREKIIIRNI